jgi:hypothetical protein
MSQIISIQKKISLEELLKAFENSDAFELGQRKEWGWPITFKPEPSSYIVFSNGYIEATSPSDKLMDELTILARGLAAEVTHEDEVVVTQNNQVEGREIVLFWPLLTIVLVVLLVIKW